MPFFMDTVSEAAMLAMPDVSCYSHEGCEQEGEGGTHGADCGLCGSCGEATATVAAVEAAAAQRDRCGIGRNGVACAR